MLEKGLADLEKSNAYVEHCRAVKLAYQES